MAGRSSQTKYKGLVININRRYCLCHWSLVTVLLVVCNKSSAKFCVHLNLAMIENCISCNRSNLYAQDTTARQSIFDWTAWVIGRKLLAEYFLEAVGRDSSVGMATYYGLDGPGIESL